MSEKRQRFPAIPSEKIKIELIEKHSHFDQEEHLWEVKVENLTHEEERSILRLSRFLYVHQSTEYECEVSTAGITIDTAFLQSRRLASYTFQFIGRPRAGEFSHLPGIHAAGAHCIDRL